MPLQKVAALVIGTGNKPPSFLRPDFLLPQIVLGLKMNESYLSNVSVLALRAEKASRYSFCSLPLVPPCCPSAASLGSKRKECTAVSWVLATPHLHFWGYHCDVISHLPEYAANMQTGSQLFLAHKSKGVL